MVGRGGLLVGLLCVLQCVASAMVGGWEPADKKSKIVQEIAAFCVSEYNQENTNDVLVKMISLQDAQQQVVAGMNYKLTIVLGNTGCKKSAINKPCPLLTGSKLKKVKCDFWVYDIPWQTKRTIEKKKCANLQ